MKRNYIAAAACILSLAACSKTELDEGVSAPKGEAVTLTVPQTKVALDGNSFDGYFLEFEGNESITAIASNGSKADLKATNLNGRFAGVFDKPVEDGSTISLYYNQSSVNSDGTVSYAQNGKPWLQSLSQAFTRDAERNINISATLKAPQGVKAIAVVTDDTDIESVEFHSKNGTALSSFDGKAFSGDSFVSQTVTENKTTNNKKCNIFYVPEGLEGGYWIKAVKGEQAMYKSYSSSEAVTKDARVIIKEFTPASLTVNAAFSGFQTSYSYYAGIDGVQKNISTANGMKNSEIKEGTVTVTPIFNGVSSKLVNFKSIELLINGTKVGDQTTASDSYTFSVPETTEWGEKKLSVKVTYTIFDGAEISEESVESTTRYITGLPYSVNFSSQPSEWSRGRNTSWSDGIKLGGGGSGDASATLSSLYIPSNIDVELSLGNIVMASIKGATIVNRSKLNVTIGSNTINSVYEGPNIGGGFVWGTKTETSSYSSYSQSGTISSQNKNIKLQQQQEQAGCYCTIGSIVLNYR